MHRLHACFLALFSSLLVTAAGAAPVTVQAGLATGTWSDGTTTGSGRTQVIEECGSEGECSFTVDADTHVGATETHGTCTDTTASLAGRNLAAAFCRAVFRIEHLQTTGAGECDATTLAGGPKGDFTFTTSDGATYRILGVELTMANGAATIQGALVAANGELVGWVTGAFPATCVSGTRYGGWHGAVHYVL